MPRWQRIVLWVAGVLAAIALVAGVALCAPLGAGELRAHPHRARSFVEARDRIAAVTAAETGIDLQPSARSYALLHGSRTTTAVVLLHGYTDTPAQFRAIAKGYYDAGANVWVPRAPYHGYNDRMTSDPSKLTPDTVRRWVDTNVDIADGLGTRVVVVGISGGGAAATWAAADRGDVAQTVIISPLLLPKGYPGWVLRPAARAILALPDQYRWWSEKKAADPGEEYPRYSLHGIASYLLLGERARTAGVDTAPPVRGSVTLVLNGADSYLDNAYALAVMRSIVPASRLTVVEIPASERFVHDIVGPVGDNGPRIKNAYRYLERALGIPLPDPTTVRR
jgi:carboxylesterase